VNGRGPHPPEPRRRPRVVQLSTIRLGSTTAGSASSRCWTAAAAGSVVGTSSGEGRDQLFLEHLHALQGGRRQEEGERDVYGVRRPRRAAQPPPMSPRRQQADLASTNGSVESTPRAPPASRAMTRAAVGGASLPGVLASRCGRGEEAEKKTIVPAGSGGDSKAGRLCRLRSPVFASARGDSLSAAASAGIRRWTSPGIRS
jgi:hypothetical protein